MNDRELDRLIARVNPYGDRTVADLPTGGAEADLLEELMDSPTLTPIGEPARPPRRIRRRLVLVAVAAVTALIALGGVVVPRLGGPAAPAPAYAAELVAVAEANDRVLIDGWKVDRVIEFSTTYGEMFFRKGKKEVSLNWYLAKDYQMYLRDRGYVSKPEKVEVLGRTGSMFHYSTAEKAAMLPPKGPTFLEIRANLGSEKEFRAMLGKLRAVDVNTWLAALPDATVTPDEKAAMIKKMLTDIPLPEGFDTRTLKTGTTTERVYVGVDVAGGVTCAWIDRWAAAKSAGDREGVREAITALRSTRSWNILKELNSQGGFSEQVWEMVDLVVAGKVALQPKPGPKGGPLTVKLVKGNIGC